MAMINCPECGKEISDKANVCPNCGFPLEHKDSDSDIVHDMESRKDDVVEEQNNSENESKPADLFETEYVDNNTFKDVNSKKVTFFKKKLKVKDKEIPIVGIIVACVIIVIIVIILMINSSNKPNNTYNNTNTTTTSYNNYGGNDSLSSDVQYISDRTVQFNDEDDEYIVFFGLQGANEEYTDSSGTATIIITDSTGNELYNNDIEFTKNDFTSWSNAMRDTSRYLCGLYIKAADIDGAASSSGTLSLKVTLSDGTYFDAQNLSIYDLKEKDLQISLPDLPAKIKNYNYSNELEEVVEVTEINIETTVHSDGEATAKVYFTVKMLENYSDSSSHYSHVGYKLKDSNGVIIDSGNASINPMEVGETAKDYFYISDLDVNKNYTLTFENSKE